eukprot:g78176.t1
MDVMYEGEHILVGSEDCTCPAQDGAYLLAASTCVWSYASHEELGPSTRHFCVLAREAAEVPERPMPGPVEGTEGHWGKFTPVKVLVAGNATEGWYGGLLSCLTQTLRHRDKTADCIATRTQNRSQNDIKQGKTTNLTATQAPTHRNKI